MHPNVFQQASLTGDSVEVADQQQAQKRFRINRRAPGLALKALQPVPHEGEVDVAIDQPEQVDLGNLIFQAERVEQRCLAGLLTHHRGRPPRLHHTWKLEERHMKSCFSTASLYS